MIRVQVSFFYISSYIETGVFVNSLYTKWILLVNVSAYPDSINSIISLFDFIFKKEINMSEHSTDTANSSNRFKSILPTCA